MRRFDPADRLCLRRVKYRFSFSDPTPDAGQSGMHAFAYFCMNEDGGLYVCPTSTGYTLKCLIPTTCRMTSSCAWRRTLGTR